MKCSPFGRTRSSLDAFPAGKTTLSRVSQVKDVFAPPSRPEYSRIETGAAAARSVTTGKRTTRKVRKTAVRPRPRPKIEVFILVAEAIVAVLIERVDSCKNGENSRCSML